MKIVSKAAAVILSVITAVSSSAFFVSAAGTAKTTVCTGTSCGSGLTVKIGGTEIKLPVICKNCGKTQTVTTKKQTGSTKQTATQNSTAGFNSAYEAEVLRLVNAERKKYGLSALTRDTGAVKAAHIRAKEIVKSFSHTRPDGSSCFTAAKEAGVTYRAAGENIAYGYGRPEQVVKGWMNSEGHRKNILSSSFTKIGIGCYSSGATLYWTQFFIG